MFAVIDSHLRYRQRCINQQAWGVLGVQHRRPGYGMGPGMIRNDNITVSKKGAIDSNLCEQTEL